MLPWPSFSSTRKWEITVPTGTESAPDVCALSWAISRAAISNAGASMNFAAESSCVRSDSTSWRSSSSSLQASCRNAARWPVATCNEAWYNSSTLAQRSGSTALASSEFAHEPDLRQLPVPHYRLWGHAQYLGGFLDLKSTKESKFHHPAFSFVE